MEVLLKEPSRAADGYCPDRATAVRLLHDSLSQLPDPAGPAVEGMAASRLDSYIRLRLIRESEVVTAVLERHPHDLAAHFIDQLGWRSYARGFLESHQSVWEGYKAGLAQARASLSGAQVEQWQRARAGATGMAGFDSCACELAATGWLSGQDRLRFASDWTFTLGLPWQLGAAHFMEHLLDADPASAILGWHRTAAGSPAPEANPLPPAQALSPSVYPDLSCCPAGLVVCPDDLTPELGELADLPFSSICVFNARDIMDATGASPLVRTWINGAVADTARRVERHWDARMLAVSGDVTPRVPVATPEHVGRCEQPRVYSGCIDHWVAGVVTWAGNENLNSVSLLQPPTGPWQDAMPALRAALRARSIRLTEYRRRWDALHWPHATQGYQPFLKGLRGRIESSYAQG